MLGTSGSSSGISMGSGLLSAGEPVVSGESLGGLGSLLMPASGVSPKIGRVFEPIRIG